MIHLQAITPTLDVLNQLIKHWFKGDNPLLYVLPKPHEICPNRIICQINFS
ncbi:hypothetical protein EFP44_04515 [Lacticaseibacillus paracasei]|nr:hypothetical protein [Lacticaseibacillus paracasei]